MAQNIQIDPQARDYVVVNGTPVPSDRVLEAAYYALQIQQGKWMYALPNQGSLIYTLNNIKRTSDIEQRFNAYATAALQAQLIDTNKASAAAVRNIEATRTGTLNNIEIIPSNIQLSQQLSFVPV